MASKEIKALNDVSTNGAKLTTAVNPATGKTVVVENVNGQLRGITDPTQVSYWYDLVVKVITQDIKNTYRGVIELGNFFTPKVWENGVKEIVVKGDPSIIENKKKVDSLDDFNWDETHTNQVVFNIDDRELIKQGIPLMTKVVEAFVSPAKLSEFMGRIYSDMRDVFEKTFWRRKLKTITGSSESKITSADIGKLSNAGWLPVNAIGVHDDVYDSAGVSTENVMKALSLFIKERQAPSPAWTRYPNDTVEYSAKASNITIFLNTKHAINVKWLKSRLYDSGVIMDNVNIVELPFHVILNHPDDVQLADAIQVIWSDNDKFEFGLSVQNFVHEFKTAFGRTIRELHNHTGYGVNTSLNSGIIFDATNMTAGQLARFEPAIALPIISNPNDIVVSK